MANTHSPHPAQSRYPPELRERAAAKARPPSTRAVADNNALAETVNGLYKTELIGRRGPWRTAEQVELATLAWIDWWNNRRLHEACQWVPPAAFEAQYYRQQHEAGEAA